MLVDFFSEETMEQNITLLWDTVTKMKQVSWKRNSIEDEETGRKRVQLCNAFEFNVLTIAQVNTWEKWLKMKEDLFVLWF